MENKQTNYEEVKVEKNIRTDSYFDGKFLEYLAYKLLAFLISLVSIGIAKPWADKLLLEYQINHTVYNGKRLKFEGKGTELFVLRFKWIIFSIITLGIYLLWIPLNMEKWVASKTHFEDEDLIENESYFEGKLLGIIGLNLFTYFVTLLTLGLLFPFAVCYKYKWIASHTIINKKRIVFNGKSLSLIGHYLLWYLLSLITFGIYGIWMPMKLYGWKIKNTHIKLKDEVLEKESKLPYILTPILIIIFIVLLVIIIPNIKIDKDKNIFDNISNKINNKQNNNTNISDYKTNTSCISDNSLNKIKESVKNDYEIYIDCNNGELTFTLATNKEEKTFDIAEKDILSILDLLTDKELNNKINISYEKYNTNNDYYLFGEKGKDDNVIKWTSDDASGKITNINRNKTNTSDKKTTKTTKKIETNKCPDNAVYSDGNCYSKNSTVSPGTCGYLTEIDGKCYYPGCDETNYLTDDNCINDYIEKPSSNECPEGYKFIDGLCYGSLAN